jgi:hypothetical protein
MKTIIATILVLLIGLGIILYIDKDEVKELVVNNPGTNNPVDNTPTETSMVKVTSPLPNASVKSPLLVTGEARGNWYFEASFPVKVLDANGKVLGIVPAQAQGEWMTTNFVPFSVSVPFSTPTTPTGTLVLEKDNPSGLPEHAAEVRIPIRFSQAATQTRNINLYFYNENKDKDAQGNILCSAKGLSPVSRTLPLTNTPIQDAVKELLKGPQPSERTQFPNTEFPLPDVSLTAASLSNGVLTLTFSDPDGSTSGGSCRVSILKAQIEATAKQFGGVNSVHFMPIGVFEP